MRALLAAGRTGDALDAYQRHLRVLRDELGIDPPAELRELHTRILREEVGPTPRQTAMDTTQDRKRGRLPTTPPTPQDPPRDDHQRSTAVSIPRHAASAVAVLRGLGPSGSVLMIFVEFNSGAEHAQAEHAIEDALTDCEATISHASQNARTSRQDAMSLRRI
jgi:hypothetical protein